MDKTKINKCKAMIVLYGDKNIGKSSLLMNLVVKLGSATNSSTLLTRAMEDAGFLKNNISQKDGMFVIDTLNRLYLVSTMGDTWAACRLSTQFFEGTINGNVHFFEVNNNAVIRLSSKRLKKILEQNKPTICITACRPIGQSNDYGPIKALHSYVEKDYDTFSYMEWIKLCEGPFQIWKSDTNAQKLYEHIKDFE